MIRGAHGSDLLDEERSGVPSAWNVMLANPVTPGMPAFPPVSVSARNGAHFGLSDVIFAPAPLFEPDWAALPVGVATT